MGIDGGSTSTKAVLLSRTSDVLCKSYQLSKGNPDRRHHGHVREPARADRIAGRHAEVLGVGTTGYAKDILKDVLNADAAMVETVAHTEAALHFYDTPTSSATSAARTSSSSSCKDGRVKDFKLNTQCSAGNGYFLQSTAEGFGYKVEEYADIAFSAKAMPVFGYGCAVFMQSDIVDFQRQGWKPEEILAGLANVLPKNIWLYVRRNSQPRLAGHDVHPAGRHAAQPGGREVAGGLHRVALPRRRARSRRHRPRALRRIRRDRRGRRSEPPLQERPSHHLHRPRRRREDQLQDHAQRRHALLLLQEQVPAHLHRRERRRCQGEHLEPHRRCRSSSPKFHWPQASAVLLSQPAKRDWSKTSTRCAESRLDSTR